MLIGEDQGAPHFAMRRFIMEAHGGMPLHTNEVEHEQYVLCGRARITIGSDVHEVSAGDLYLAIVAAAAFATYVWATEGWSLVAAIRPRKLGSAIFVTPLIAGVILVLFMIKPLFAPRQTRQDPRTLDPDDEPFLHAFIRRVAEAVGAPEPRRIDVDCQVNAWAGFRRGVLSFAGRDLATFFVWISRTILRGLMNLGHLVSSYLLRQMGFDADRYEARLVGSRTFESTCRELSRLGVAAYRGLAGRTGDLRRIREGVKTVFAAAEQLQRSPGDESLNRRISEELEAIHGAIGRVREGVEGLVYPFDHSDGEVDLAGVIVRGRPDIFEPNELLALAQDVLQRGIDVTWRVLTRLAAIAEAAERDAGLEPAPLGGEAVSESS